MSLYKTSFQCTVTTSVSMRSSAVFPDAKEFLAAAIFFITTFLTNVLIINMPGKVKVRILAARNLPVMDRSSDTTDAFAEVKLADV